MNFYTYRVSVKSGSGWFIVYEGSDLRWVDEVKKRYKDKEVSVERI